MGALHWKISHQTSAKMRTAIVQIRFRIYADPLYIYYGPLPQSLRSLDLASEKTSIVQSHTLTHKHSQCHWLTYSHILYNTSLFCRVYGMRVLFLRFLSFSFSRAECFRVSNCPKGCTDRTEHTPPRYHNWPKIASTSTEGDGMLNVKYCVAE